MKARASLEDYLSAWARNEQAKAAAETILVIASAGKMISKLIAQGQLAGAVGAVVGTSNDGDGQKELDRLTNVLTIDALKEAPVAFVASEELPDAVSMGKQTALLSVALDPLDGSSNIDANVSIGTIFSILPRSSTSEGGDDADFLQPGENQLAAGYIIYGPHTALVLTVGEGTHNFTLDPDDGCYKLVAPSINVPVETREFAINTSNYRHWDECVQQYIDDCLDGNQGPRKKNYNMRWVGSMVAECHRILTRGGIYIYPGDARSGYGNGRLRLIYEANPIAFLMEQSGGAATSGLERILEIVPEELHQRIPLIFGSAREVAKFERYVGEADRSAEASPLFGQRGLFRSQGGR